MLHLFGLPAFIDWHWLWLAVAAFLAGILNAVAGGGSFLSFPAMLGMKMLPIQANATNSVAVWPGQLTSVAGYNQDIRRNPRMALLMASAGLLGGSSGALVLLHTPQRTFMQLVPWLLLSAAIIFAISGPVSRKLESRMTKIEVRSKPLPGLPVFLAITVICFYIGYFGAGAGLLLITALSLFGWQDLHEINALKVSATTPANGIACILFIANHQVVWRCCLLAMVVCAIGGYYAAVLARRVPQSLLRAIVVVIGLTMAAWFFWRQ
jgi:hypothetical protein